MPHFTPTQQTILDVLSDGMTHHREELRQHIDDLASYQNLQSHICALRKLLHPIGQDIVCVLANRTIYYRHIRVLASAYDGKR